MALKSELGVVMAGARSFAQRNFLPLAFAVAFVVALTCPNIGRTIVAPQVMGVHISTFACICIVFFISGLTLRTDELKDAFTRRAAPGTLFALASIIGFTPLLGFAVRALPFIPGPFATGLTIFCIVPTTLGVGVSLVTAAQGNVALAVFLTVFSNLLGVIAIPMWLTAMLKKGAAGVDSLTINALDIFVKLLISFLVPTLAGKALRELCPPVNRFQKAQKPALSMLSNSVLALLILQTLSSGREVIVNARFGDMLAVIVTVAAIHVLYLIANTLAVTALRVPLREAIAAVIMASQKSAPVAVAVITYMTADVKTQGVLAVPCVVGQLIQIFLGQPLAHYLSDRVGREEAEGAAEPLLPSV